MDFRDLAVFKSIEECESFNGFKLIRGFKGHCNKFKLHQSSSLFSTHS